ncbi:MAG: hypothetical protein AAGI53_08225 [Planctomycetota bacterium]
MNTILRHCTFLALSICFIGIATSCSQEASSEEPVSWPELARFDDLAFRADGFARVGDLDAVQEARAELLEAGRAVTSSTVPSNVADPDQVATILSDLVSLVDGLSSEADGERLGEIVLGLHTVIENLINAAGMPHVHANEGPNAGFLQPVFDSEGVQVGTAEVKLHDDVGDIEVWLTSGGFGGDPWRLPVDTTLTMTVPDFGATVTLAVRDRERNEDESGASTIIDGSTDYFVFPGASGADASWLTGPEFAVKAALQFDDATTGSFVLRPHVHRTDTGP